MEQQARYRLARPAAPPPLLVAVPPPPLRHRLRLHHQELTFDLFLFKEMNTIFSYCAIDSPDPGLGDFLNILSLFIKSNSWKTLALKCN